MGGGVTRRLGVSATMQGDHRATIRPVWLLSSALVFAVACAPGDGMDAREILERSAEAMSTADPDAGLVLYASGVQNKTAEGQGFDVDAPSLGSLEERIAWDPSTGSARLDYREERFDGTTEVFGESLHDGLHRLFIRDAGLVIPFRSSEAARGPNRLNRRLPLALVRELLDHPESPAMSARTDSSWLLEGRIADTLPVSVEIAVETFDVLRYSHSAVLPAQGEVEISWWFADFSEIGGGGRWPQRYGVTVDGVSYTEMSVDSVVVGGELGLEADPDLRVLEVRDEPSDERPALDLESLSPGVYRVPDVRSGFAPLVVEFERSLIVVDAPASFPLLGQIPVGETDPSASMSEPSERLIDLLRSRWPDKPISHLLLTHHHQDHIGGVRAFVANETVIVGTAPSIDAARRVAALPGAEVGDRLAENPRELVAEVVETSRVWSDASQEVAFVPVGENPHADGIAVIHLPRLDLMYVSDLMTPGPVDEYPAPSHCALDTFLHGWLASFGGSVAEVVSMHGSDRITGEHFARLEGGGCG